MIKPVSSVIAAGLLAAVFGARAAAQPARLDSIPLPLTNSMNETIAQAMQQARDTLDRLPPDFSDRVADAVDRAMGKAQGTMFALQDAKPRPAPSRIGPAPMPPMPPAFSSADAMYQQARAMIDRDRFDEAVKRLNDLIDRFQTNKPIDNRVDAAFYWKAYALGKEQQISDALNTIADLQKRFADSRWLKDAKALELELRQSSGQAVSPDAQNDEELKLLALRGVMRSDPDRAIPMIEQLLAGNSSINVKENALFVLSQSQAPKARDIIVNTARNGTNPDLQIKAVRYLGVMRTPDSAQMLTDIYKSASDSAVKRAILQSLVSEGAGDRIVDVARSEKDPDLRRAAIRDLGAMSSDKTGDTLRAMYTSESSVETKHDIADALYVQRNAAALVALARAEKDPGLKKDIVSRLSTMRSKEATDYMLELLK